MPANSFQVRVQTSLTPPGLRLRSQPNTSSNMLTFEAPGALLTVLEPEAQAKAKIGVDGQWLRVRDANSLEGYVAAWYVESAPAGSSSAPASSATQGSTSAPKPPANSVPVSNPAAQSVKAPTPQALTDAINAERAKKKLPPLKANSILTSNAQKHAEYMASGGGITHESADGSRPFQRHLAAGFPLAGDLSLGGFASENIVAGPNMTVQEAIASWYGDDPHTHTMLGDKYTDCGAGVAVSGDMIYYCFDAARSTSSSASSNVTPPPTGSFVVYVPASLERGLRIRKAGNASAGLVRAANAGEWLEVLEPAADAKAKIGVEDAWLKVKDKLGNVGYVAAWLVSEKS